MSRAHAVNRHLVKEWTHWRCKKACGSLDVAQKNSTILILLLLFCCCFRHVFTLNEDFMGSRARQRCSTQKKWLIMQAIEQMLKFFCSQVSFARDVDKRAKSEWIVYMSASRKSTVVVASLDDALDSREESLECDRVRQQRLSGKFIYIER